MLFGGPAETQGRSFESVVRSGAVVAFADLGMNTGPMPSGLWRLKNMVELTLSNNKLSGESRSGYVAMVRACDAFDASRCKVHV